MAHDVFISYASADKLTADAACNVLESKGLRCWISPRDILPGRDWGEAIIDAISEVKVFLLIFSSNANTSNQIKREVERAVSRGIPIIPVRIEDVSPTKSLEYFISSPHWLDAFTPPLRRHLDYLADVIHNLLRGDVGERDSGGNVAAPGRDNQPRTPFRLAMPIAVAAVVIGVAVSAGLAALRGAPRAQVRSPPVATQPAAIPSGIPDAVAGAVAGKWRYKDIGCDDPILISVSSSRLNFTFPGSPTVSADAIYDNATNAVITHPVDGQYTYVPRGSDLTLTGPQGSMELKRCGG